jgi:hypothetical protein
MTPIMQQALTPMTITGCWEGSLISDQGGAPMAFSLRQPARSANALMGMTVTLANAAPEPARLLDGAARTIVALVESTQLLIEARVRSGRMVGRWLRRNAEGTVIEKGKLEAGRAA